MDDRQFDTILDRFNRSRRGYRRVRKGVKKRLVRHMQRLGCTTVTSYLTVLENNSEALQECERLLTVSISRFFRDRRLWTILHDFIIPGFIERHAEGLTAWFAGCALGQEAYSFKMMWAEAATPIPRLFVLATDGNPLYLRRAKQGIYDESMLKEVPRNLKNRYFHPTENGTTLEIDSTLKKNIRWLLHDFVHQHPPEKQFKLIFLRNNLLTYYRREVQESALCPILSRLAGGGFLIIGSHEHLPFHPVELAPYRECPFIFQKI
ncbi:MAG: hypothetical protein JW736_01080 [Deltaproteobacteria bacterium]|nr:hypothetical protein [Deltaproteobacteria bacterium]MBN2686988.1 hypothetical protein [Deltaproteobacteria bacterium]